MTIIPIPILNIVLKVDMEVTINKGKINSILIVIALGLAFINFGCRTIISMPEGQYEPGEETKYRQDQNLSTEKENVADTQINSAPVVQPENSPRVLASMQLTEQAYRFIKVNRPDDAIRVLERSLNLSPTNGQTFYYLAEAWLMKRNIQQAIEFNRLSEIYLRDDPVWMIRVEKQRELLIK